MYGRTAETGAHSQHIHCEVSDPSVVSQNQQIAAGVLRGGQMHKHSPESGESTDTDAFLLLILRAKPSQNRSESVSAKASISCWECNSRQRTRRFRWRVGEWLQVTDSDR